jgi:putative acetyltransferase
MPTEDFIIREINPQDNLEIAGVIRAVFNELNVPKIGTAYEDEATDKMFENFQKEKSVYFVVEHKKKIVGGAGIAQLDDFTSNTCELQKMYFAPITRGKGIGKKLISQCLLKAKALGYENCYLETMPYMHAAKALYAKNGFEALEKPLGNTGHYSCTVWMLKKL